jgi:hypothetical protein
MELLIKMDRTQHQSYEPWKVGIFPEGYSDVESLLDGFSGLEVNLIFHNANQLVRVRFGQTDVYRVIDEGYRLKQLQHLPLPMEETLYIVSQSDMIQELVDEACGLLNSTDLIHYFIITSNDCIDVIVRNHGDEPQLKYKSVQP